MPPDLLTYLAAVLILVLSPGPNLAIVLGNAVAGGRPAGLATVAGIVAGFGLYALATAGGLASLLVAVPGILGGLRLAGAAYLVWLGIRGLLRARTAAALPAASPHAGWRDAARDGLVTNLLNPKVVLFYVALVPNFIDPAGSVFHQSLALASLHAAVAATWFTLVTLAAAQVDRGLHRPRTVRLVQTISGTALILFGLRMALG